MTQIVFCNNFPILARASVETALHDFRWILPVWLQRLYVGYHADEQEAAAYIQVEKDYRFANLKVCGHWIEAPADLQKEQLLHELIHLYNVPVKNFALEQIDSLCGEADEKLFKLIKSELVAKNEAATADLTFALMNKLGND